MVGWGSSLEKGPTFFVVYFGELVDVWCLQGFIALQASSGSPVCYHPNVLSNLFFTDTNVKNSVYEVARFVYGGSILITDSPYLFTVSLALFTKFLVLFTRFVFAVVAEPNLAYTGPGRGPRRQPELFAVLFV